MRNYIMFALAVGLALAGLYFVFGFVRKNPIATFQGFGARARDAISPGATSN